jgi:predicted regulator of Ras-like GTPase activity (Roadblock/LC7/MglB family)
MSERNEWEALFGAYDEAQNGFEREEPSSPATVSELRKLPGVLGVVQVAANGVILADETAGDPNQQGASAAYVASFANQINQLIDLGEMTYGLLSVGEDAEQLMVIRYRDLLYGLLLDSNISPTHIVSRLNNGIR